ncbi:MAG TPA: hypothetical protein DEV93_09625 [Chloroflexi bacterium]|nr:hypothetical protein [Chloroflexota bacterium]
MNGQITAALLLLGGALCFLVGAAIPIRWLEVWFSPAERHLELIAAHRGAWSWINGLMIAAVVLNAAGLSVLGASTLQPEVIAGATGYSIGSVWWVIVASYRSTTALWAADRLASTKRLPEVFEALDGWMGLAFRIYILIAYGSELVVGAGLLQTAVVPNWTAWIVVLLGVGGFLSQMPGTTRISALRSMFEVPIVVHVAPAVVAITLLVR